MEAGFSTERPNTLESKCPPNVLTPCFPLSPAPLNRRRSQTSSPLPRSVTMSDQDIRSMDDDRFPEPDIICPHSDLFLVVGPNKQPIGVDARSLRRVSKVFEAMFRPPWLESTKLSENRISPLELALPEDDFRAMNVICCIIHHRNDLVPADLLARDILKIAIVADKYDMLAALKFAAAGWLKTAPQSDTSEADSEAILSMGNLLAAAFLFREAEQFRDLSVQLMFNYGGSYREIAKSSLIVDVLGAEVPGKMSSEDTTTCNYTAPIPETFPHHTTPCPSANGYCRSNVGGTTNSNQGRDSPVPRQPPDVVCPLSIWVSESQAVQAYPVVHLVGPGTAAGEARSFSDPGCREWQASSRRVYKRSNHSWILCRSEMQG